MVAPVRPGKGAQLPDPEAKAFGHASYNALNVAVTRAQFGTCIFTNSKEGLAREVEVAETKRSTLDKIFRDGGRIGPAGAGELPRPGQLVGLGKEIGALGRSLAKSGGGMPRLSVESIGIPQTPTPYHELFKPVPQLQKSMGKELQLQRLLVKELELSR